MTLAEHSTSNDVIQLLEAQHTEIKRLFAATLESRAEERERAFFELRRLLAVHETAEEEIIHPHARSMLSNGDAIVDDRLHEEQSAKTVLTELEDMSVDSDEFTAKLTSLRDAVIEHAEHEERDEFHVLRAEIPAEESQRLVNAVALAESIAPTRPHPHINTAGENILVGPFAAMLDRARDAINGPKRTGQR